MVALGIYEYRESSIGPYSEVGLVIPVVPIGVTPPDNWVIDFYKPPLDRKMGFYVLNLPATSEVAVAAGIEIWGYNKIFTDIDFYHEGNTIDVTVHDPDSESNILNFSCTLGMSMPAQTSNPLNFSVIDNVPLKTIIHVTGTYNMYVNFDSLLTVGESLNPMAQNLREMGVDGTSPTMLLLSTNYQAILYLGNPM